MFFLVFMMEELADRFSDIEKAQEWMLDRIHKFKESSDVSDLPDMAHVEQIDAELHNIVKDLDKLSSPGTPAGAGTPPPNITISDKLGIPPSIPGSPAVDPVATSIARRRRRNMDGYVVDSTSGPPVMAETTPTPSFSAVMKSIVNEDANPVLDQSVSSVSMGEDIVAAPDAPVFSHPKTYYPLPPPVTSLPVSLLLTPPSEPVTPVHFEISTPKSGARSVSPLKQANERKQVSTKKVQELARLGRERVERIIDLLSHAEQKVELFVCDSKKIRVKSYGITGAYLFQKPKPIEEVVAAVRIQKWFRRWRKRVKIPKVDLANLGRMEVSDRRAKLRERREKRMELRQAEKSPEVKNPPIEEYSPTSWMRNILAPLQAAAAL